MEHTASWLPVDLDASSSAFLLWRSAAAGRKEEGEVRAQAARFHDRLESLEECLQDKGKWPETIGYFQSILGYFEV